MAETVEFQSNGKTASGYLVKPSTGSGPGVLVIRNGGALIQNQEMADRLAAAGFVAMAPDLYHGELAGHDEMDKAAHLMQSLPPERAGRDMSGAVDYLSSHEAVTRRGIGVVGFCMGGMLSFLIAANRPDTVKAVVPFYGFPQGDMEPDWSKLTASISGHMASTMISSLPPPRARRSQAQGNGQERDADRSSGTGHAFMAPHNALGTLNATLAAQIWP
jgi:carboxymethylenebutenolidase